MNLRSSLLLRDSDFLRCFFLYPIMSLTWSVVPALTFQAAINFKMTNIFITIKHFFSLNVFYCDLWDVQISAFCSYVDVMGLERMNVPETDGRKSQRAPRLSYRCSSILNSTFLIQVTLVFPEIPPSAHLLFPEMSSDSLLTPLLFPSLLSFVSFLPSETSALTAGCQTTHNSPLLIMRALTVPSSNTESGN